MTWWYVPALIGQFHELKVKTAELNRQFAVRKAERAVAEAERQWAIVKAKNTLNRHKHGNK